tara:strand:- start:140 stop:457 length:318 start_codon:yes stop_codon:yes gene_type:complete
MSLQHWKFQRISALIMIPVIIISVSYLINITSLTYDELILDLGSTSVKIIGSFFIGFILYHSSMGLEVIIEDYVHAEGIQKDLISFTKLLHITSFFMTVLILASI